MNWIKRIEKSVINKRDSIKTKVAKLRGIEDIDEFLNPGEDTLHSPYLLMNIEVVTERIIKALQNGERIAISADVDVDGVSSAASLYRYLKQFTENVYIVYHQRGEGHGVENQLKYIDDETKLIAILDSSTNSSAACKELQNRNVDVLVVDHHKFENKNPYAIIVNPQLDNYPNKHISGSGLTYKLIQVLDDKLGTGTVEEFIDLAAVGMVADMMDMSVLENRYIVAEGMSNIVNPGLRAVLDECNVELDDVTTTTIGFNIGPLINGVARMDKIELAIQLLTEDDFVECKKLVKEMNKVNEERKRREKELTDMYEKQVDLSNKIIIVTGDDPSKSFNGLVANKLMQKYKRPVIVARDFNGEIKGSFRSPDGFNLLTYLQKTGLVKYALGHEPAGGVGIATCNLDDLIVKINKDLAKEEFKSDIIYDFEFDGTDITYDLVEAIEEINRITGKGFEKIKVRVNDLIVEERIVLGKNKDTIKFKTDCLDTIRFKEDEKWGSQIEVFDCVDAVGTININKYFNYKYKKIIETIQIILDDLPKERTVE